MRLELGPVRIVLEQGEDPNAVLWGLFRRLTNKEVAEIIGVSDRTVHRWKEDGYLPSRGNGQITLVDLLSHLQPLAAESSRQSPGPRRRHASASGKSPPTQASPAPAARPSAQGHDSAPQASGLREDPAD